MCLFIFKDNLFTLSHMAISFRSSFILFSIHVGSLLRKNKFVSSANNMGNAELHTEGKSVTYTRNIKGPKIDPWGTANFIIWWYKLGSICKITFQPLVSTATNAIMIEFVQTNRMVNRMEGLCEVKKYTHYIFTIFNSMNEFIHSCKQGHVRRVTFSKA